MAGSGFSVRVKTDHAAALRRLKKIQFADMQTAKKLAFRRATLSVVSDVSTKLASGLGVPRWMIRGVGVTSTDSEGTTTKSSGSRLGRSGYVKRIDGAIVFLRQSHINPVGTAKKQNRTTQLKSGGLRVNGVGITYKKGFLIKSKYFGQVYTRDGENLKAEQIPFPAWARSVLRNRTQVVGARVFRERFKHEMRRLIKKRVK
jgi:hypothetical protein